MCKQIIISKELNDFVDTYFVKMDFARMGSVTQEDVVKTLSQVENALVNIQSLNFTEDNPQLWFNREVCLRALVILTQLDFFASILEQAGFIERALMLLSRVVETFNKKIVEDPEIVKAIQEGRLDEELEKHFPSDKLTNKRTSNFIEIVDNDDLEYIPEDYEKIPEKF